MTARQWWLVALSGILLLDTLILIALGKINLGTVLPGGSVLEEWSPYGNAGSSLA